MDDGFDIIDPTSYTSLDAMVDSIAELHAKIDRLTAALDTFEAIVPQLSAVLGPQLAVFGIKLPGM